MAECASCSFGWMDGHDERCLRRRGPREAYTQTIIPLTLLGEDVLLAGCLSFCRRGDAWAG